MGLSFRSRHYSSRIFLGILLLQTFIHPGCGIYFFEPPVSSEATLSSSGGSASSGTGATSATTAQVTKEWTHIVLDMHLGTTFTTDPPAVAINDSGQAIFAWTQSDGAKLQVYKAERSANGTWTTPASAADNISPDGQDAASPLVAMNASGEAVITWSQINGVALDTDIYKAERAADGTWTIPADLTDRISITGSGASYPHVAINDSGEVLIVFVEGGAIEGIYKAERDSAGTWVLPTVIGDSISPAGSSPKHHRIAFNSATQAVVTWYQTDLIDGYQIYKAERATNGTWTKPANLADNISPALQSATYPQVTMNDSGQAIITWTQSDGTQSQIFKAERAANLTWTLPATLADNISTDGYAADEFAQTAINASGGAMITWSQSDSANTQIYKAERATDGSWTVPTDHHDTISPSGQNASLPQIALNNSGTAIITWNQSDGTHTQIFAAQGTVNGTWTVPLLTQGLFASTTPKPTGTLVHSISMNASGEIIMGYTAGNYGASVSTYR